MKINFTLKKEAILALQENVVESSYTHQVKSKYFKWGLFVVLLLISILLWRAATSIGIAGLIISIVFLGIAPRLYSKLAQASLKRNALKQDYTAVLAPCRMEFTETGIMRWLHEEESFFKWDEFTRYSEDEQYYFWYVDDLQALIIPRYPHKVEDANIETYQQNITLYADNVNKD